MSYETVDAAFVLDHLGTMPLLDVRPLEMYEEGRIPGAVSVRLMEAVGVDGDTADVFAERVAEAGFASDDKLIVYCHMGVLAGEACNLLESRGYTNLLCYEGSWIDWISDPTHPIER